MKCESESLYKRFLTWPLQRLLLIDIDRYGHRVIVYIEDILASLNTVCVIIWIGLNPLRVIFGSILVTWDGTID